MIAKQHAPLAPYNNPDMPGCITSGLSAFLLLVGGLCTPALAQRGAAVSPNPDRSALLRVKGATAMTPLSKNFFSSWRSNGNPCGSDPNCNGGVKGSDCRGGYKGVKGCLDGRVTVLYFSAEFLLTLLNFF